MVKKLFDRHIAFLLALAIILSVLPPTALAATGSVRLTVVDTNGNAVSLDPDTEISVTFNGTAVDVTGEDGVYSFSRSWTNRNRTATVTISKDGYESLTTTISSSTTSATLTLTPTGPEYVTFDLFYYIGTQTNTFPSDGYAAGGLAENYGPSGNDICFAQIEVNITELKTHTDAVSFVEGSNGNQWHFVPLVENSVESTELFWDAVLACTTEESIEALKATGLYDQFVGYCLKNQGGGGDYHGDGILAENPPAYVVELRKDGEYVGGTVNGADGPFPTTADVLDLLEGYLGHNITWNEDENGDPVASNGVYSGTYILQEGNTTTVYTITVTQTNASEATTEIEGTDIKYKEVGEYYYLAAFDIETAVSSQTVSYTVTYTDGVDTDVIFYDHEYGANNGNTVPAFTGSTLREDYTFEGWLLENDGVTYTDEQIAGMTVSEDMVFHAVWAAIPQYTGTVEVVLNGTYDMTTATATGQRISLSQVLGSNYTLCVLENDSSKHIPLTETEAGVYTATLDIGEYTLYYHDHSDDSHTLASDQYLIIETQNRTRYLFFYTLEYDLNGGSGGPEALLTYHRYGTAVTVAPEAPTREGYLFTGWLDGDGNLWQPGDTLTDAIYAPSTLTAQWEEAQDVYIHIKIDHTPITGGTNNSDDKHNITFTLDTRQAGSTGDFTEIFSQSITWDGSSEFLREDFAASYYALSDSEYTLYEGLQPSLTNVSKNMEYTFTTAKSGYSILSITQEEDENGDLQIYAELIYDPNNFDFQYQVRLDDASKALPTEYWPAAVNVKVTSWYDTPYDEDYGLADDDTTVDWYTITQQRSTYERIALDENGEGSGTYPVWIHTSDGDLSYHYRIEVVSYELSDGTILAASDVDGAHTEYVSDGNRYFANILVTDGQDPDTTDADTLTGAYYTENGQQGTVEAVIRIPVYTVTYVPNGGSLNGTTETTVVPDLLLVPGKTEYVPTRDGGYVFDGWYLADENGLITDQPAPYGTDLVEDITLIARWKAPLTIDGTVYTAGYYEQTNADGTVTVQILHHEERVHTVEVRLQRIYANGYAETVDMAYVDLLCNEDEETPVSSGGYIFEEIPDDGSVYRILIRSANFSVAYQNEPDSLASPESFDTYTATEEDYIALLGTEDPTTATVNAWLAFDPQTFSLEYQVDATAIGEDFRPDSAHVLITYNADSTISDPTQWPVISQMVFDGAYIGHDTALIDGIGSGSDLVWQTYPDGTTYTNYGLRLVSTTTGGTETAYTENPYFAVTYQAPAHYVADGSQSQLLIATLTPRQYAINYVANGGTILGEHTTTHTWSHETQLDEVTPVRTGYTFLGWYTDEALTQEAPTVISADVAQDTTLYAKWQLQFTVVFHSNNGLSNGGEDVYRVYYPSALELPEGSQYYHLSEDGTVPAFYDLPEFGYEDHNDFIFRGWYLVDGTPMDWDAVYTEDTHLFAHWIETGDVAQEDDGKDLPDSWNGIYQGYDLTGLQIRTSENDPLEHYGTAGGGLRFITVLKEEVYDQINALSEKNASGAEYGFVLAKESAVEAAMSDGEDYWLAYKGSNVNGVDTTGTYSYVINVKCSGVPDHFNGENYRLYTAVLTYRNAAATGEEALAEAHASNMVARSYIRYYDANGLYRTYYNNYTGTTRVGGGVSTNYNAVLGLLKGE